MALAGEFFLVGVVAEILDDVGLPLDGTIARIGGIERRFLVHVIGIAGAQLAEDLGRGIAGNRL